jgi:hypothetical protein
MAKKAKFPNIDGIAFLVWGREYHLHMEDSAHGLQVAQTGKLFILQNKKLSIDLFSNI